MDKYKNTYNNMTEKINKLVEKLSSTKKEYEEKKYKLEDALVDKVFIEDDLNDLKDDKEHMIKSKEEKISNIFGYIHTSTLALSCIAGCAIGAYCLSEYISVLKPLIITSSIMTVELLISNIIEKYLIKKSTIKIENSEQYKNLIIEINEKEEELKNLKEIIPNLKKEFNDVELRVNMLNNEIEELKESQLELKEEIFEKIMGITKETIEDRPLTKKRTK